MKKIIYLSLICLSVLGVTNLTLAMMRGSGGHNGEAIAQSES